MTFILWVKHDIMAKRTISIAKLGNHRICFFLVVLMIKKSDMLVCMFFF